MSTTFHVPENGASSTVASPRSPGDPTLVLASGSGFGTAYPKIVTVTRAGAVLCILEATARVTSTLTISGAIEGTSDVSMIVGDVVELRPTKLAMTELQTAVNALEAVPEVSVTGTTTLTTSAIGKMHAVTGSSTFNLTFPTAVGVANETIGVRCDAGYTGLLTLLGNSGQTFAGIAGLVMHAKESAVWKSDGSNWVRVGGTGPIPLTLQIQRALSSTAALTNSVWTDIPLDTRVFGLAAMFDAVNGRATCVRPGVYSCVVFAYVDKGAAGATEAYLSIDVNGGLNTAGFTDLSTGQPAVGGTFTAAFTLAAGDWLAPDVFVLTGATATVLGAAAPCTFTMIEIPAW